MDWGQTDVEDVLLLWRKVLSKHTVITTLLEEKKNQHNKTEYCYLGEKGILFLRLNRTLKITKMSSEGGPYTLLPKVGI